MLHPSKHNIYDHTREEYEQGKSIEEILHLLRISVDEYYYYLTISEDDHPENYVADGLCLVL